MIKAYRIIPLVFILFFFGFTLITVAPVLAEDSPEFVACQQIKPSGDFRLMKQKKDCFMDVARALQGQSGNSMRPDAATEPACSSITIAGCEDVHGQWKEKSKPTYEALEKEISELTKAVELAQIQVKSVNQNVADNIIPMLDSVRQGRDRLRDEVQYLCKLSGGGGRLLVESNLKRMCIPSTANDYGYEVK